MERRAPRRTWIVLALLVVAAAAAAGWLFAAAAQPPRIEELEEFVPSEELPADSAVSFPVDI